MPMICFPKAHFQIPSYEGFTRWILRRHTFSPYQMGSKTTMVTSKHSTYLIEVWLLGFLISKGLEPMSQRANSEEEMKYHSICPSSLRFLTLIGWCIGMLLIYFSQSNSTDQKIYGKLSQILALGCVSSHVLCCDIFFLQAQLHKFLYCFSL